MGLLQVALLPYAIFSLFHALTFIRTTVMPQFLQPGPPAVAGGPPQPHPIAKKLQVWVKGKIPWTLILAFLKPTTAVCSQL
jgi:hypothetical protein